MMRACVFTFMVALSLALLATAAMAEVPSLINYQGTLADVSGVALDTTVSMTFSIYSDSASGTQIWTETQPTVVVSHGIFNVLLGTVNVVSDTVFNHPSRWLSVQVGGDPELTPRQRIAAVGYALRAAESDTADYARTALGGSDGDWTISGDDIYSTVPGNVGIGTSSPEFKLSLDSDGAVIAKGAYGTGDSLITSGIGTRLIWYPRKAAFRAGQAGLVSWDEAYIGDYSAAFGSNTWAEGEYAFATGVGSQALGDVSTALGRDTYAEGQYSTATGFFSKATGLISTAMGNNSMASGDVSFAAGQSATASGFRSVAMGYHAVAGPADNTMVLGTSPGSSYYLTNNIENSLMVGFNSDIPTLFVGPGNGAGTTGKVGIGTTSPAEKLHVIGNAHIDSTLTVNDNVGIGTSSPEAKLEVVGDILMGTASGGVLEGTVDWNQGDFHIKPFDNFDTEVFGIKWRGNAPASDSMHMSFYWYGAGDRAFRFVDGNAGSERMRIEAASGRVGIGTTDPMDLLDVNGDIRVRGADIKDAGGTARVTLTDNGRLDLKEDGGSASLSIDTNGRVGIATTSPAHALHVAGHEMIQGPDGFNSSGEQATLYLGDTAKYLRATYGGVLALYSNDPISIRTFADSSQLHLKTNGRVGVGTDSPTRKLWVNGDAGGTSAWYNDSDERLKQDIKNIEGALEKIKQLRGINFRWRDIEHHPRGLQMGLIAQEVKEVVPEVVEKKGEYYSLATSNLVPLLIEAIKEQQKAIEKQASKIIDLQAQLDALR